MVILTLIVLGSGVALVVGAHSSRHSLLLIHKASFILWFAAMTIHVLGHVLDTARRLPWTGCGGAAVMCEGPACASGPSSPAWSPGPYSGL